MSTRSRSAFQAATGVVTGLATFGALVGTGWVTGAASADYEEEQAKKAAERDRVAQEHAAWLAENPAQRIVEKRREHRTVVRIVHVAPSAVAPGPGGTVTQHPGSGSSSATSGSSGGSGSGASSTPAAPPPPPPPPPPAPSSGS